MEPTAYDMMQARQFCDEHELPVELVEKVAALIAAVRDETKAACAEKAMQAIDQAWTDATKLARIV